MEPSLISCQRTARDLAARHGIEVTPAEVGMVVSGFLDKLRAKLARRGWWVKEDDDLVALIREVMASSEQNDKQEQVKENE